MKEVKIRVYDYTNKMMVYFPNIWNIKRPCTEASPLLKSSPKYHKLSDPMLCTNKIDKNDKEIYEEDIIIPGDNYPLVVKYDATGEHSETVGYYTEEKDDRYGKRYHCLYHLTCKPKVIGNTYENPEILKKQ